MSGGEIAIIVIIAVIFVVCSILFINNSKKINNKAKLEKEKAQSEAKTEQKSNDSTKTAVKKIVEENSIEVENYIKDTLLKEELEAKELNKSITFEEVSNEEILKPIENGDFESGAIILGKKQSSVHTFLDDEDEEDLAMNTISITNELDAKEEDIISNKHKDFDIERTDEELIDKTVSGEINDLSKSAKAVIISGLFDKIDN